MAFLGGILLVQQLPSLPSLWWGALALVPLCFAVRRPPWLIVTFFIVGIVWASFRAGLVLDDALTPELEGRDLTVIGHVADIPQHTEFGFRFLFDIDNAWDGDTPAQVPRRVQLNSSVENLIPRAGERMKLRVRLARPHGFQNPGGFDYEGHLFRNRIRARGYVRAEATPQILEHPSPRYGVARARQTLGERIAVQLPQAPFAGVIVALANGDARRVTETQWDGLRATGTIHLVAISGLHISLIGGLVFFLVRFLWRLPGITVLWCPAPIAAALGALAAATAYAALAGFVVPTQRALIMLAVVMSGIFWRRRFAPTQLLAAALWAVLIYDPLSIMAPGFWLSFCAVAVILFIADDTQQQAWWRRVTYPQFAIGVGMLPLLLALFQKISLVSPLANLIAIPVFDLIAVPLTLLGIVTLPMSADVAGVLFSTAAWFIEQLWPLLEWLGNLPHAQWAQHSPPAWTLACALVGVVVLLAPRGWPARWVGAVWWLPLFFIAPPTPAKGELWFTLLDVGQGLASVIRTQHHTLVFDTGPRFSESFDTGEAVVVPYLRAIGVGQIDILVISHGDNDHRGGAMSLTRAMPVRHTVSSMINPPFLSAACIAGTRWNWDGVEFEILHPSVPHDDGNDSSCVLMVRSAYGRLLLPGDAEIGAEREMLARYRGRLAAEVLIAPHHGSKTSSHAEFIADVQPTHVLFPVGYRNRYRHPHPAVVERYRVAGAALYYSPVTGALELRFDANGIHSSAYRESHSRYWYTDSRDPNRQ